jgi:serpin B
MKFYSTILFFFLISLSVLGQDDYVKSTVTRNNAYSFKLYKSLNTNSENIVLSPFGVSTCMAMSYIGSEGKTQESIADELNFITPFGVLFSFKQLIKRYQIYKSNEINLLIGNALWTNNEFDMQKKYKNMLKMNFAAHVQSLNLGANSERNAKVINRWVKKSSNSNIRSIIQPEKISEYDNLMYTNYLYLNGNWENAFNEQFTSKSDFYNADSTKTKVDFMNQTSYLRYNENDIFQIIELPYSGRNISMIVILPKRITDLDSIENALNPVNFDFWNGELYTKLVSVSLPKFKIEFSQDLATLIRDQGVEMAFSEEGNFSKISEDKVYISKLIQKTIIEVNENKNSNFTQLIITPEQMRDSKDKSFIRFNANRPFLFIVKDNTNNSILLVGKLIYPNLSNLSAEFRN